MADAADWPELHGRAVPDWFHDAKLGVFLHWGLYSVPAWAPRVDDVNAIIARRGPAGMYRSNPYAEWYMNSARVRRNPTREHHRAAHGGRPYLDFAREFDRATADADTDALARELRGAGAEYVVLTAKHHDGFALWPTDVAHPRRGVLRAQRDLVGDLGDSVRSAGMRMGLYYSGGYDWSVGGRVMRTTGDALLGGPVGPRYEAYASAHVRELVDRYRPSVLWNDIGWPGGGDLRGLFAHYYRQVPDGVVNDRWAQGPARRGPLRAASLRVAGGLMRLAWPLLPASSKQLGFAPSPHADFATPEYATFEDIHEQKWEQTRGIGHSFALNRNERPEDLLSVGELVHGFVDVVSKNGNLLLGIGPEPDGTISGDQRRVVAGLGEWLRVNGDAVKRTRPWRVSGGVTSRGTPVRYTRGAEALHAILLDERPAGGDHVLPQVAAHDGTRVELLGAGAVAHEVVDGRLRIRLPDRLPPSPAHALRIRGAG